MIPATPGVQWLLHPLLFQHRQPALPVDPASLGDGTLVSPEARAVTVPALTALVTPVTAPGVLMIPVQASPIQLRRDLSPAEVTLPSPGGGCGGASCKGYE